MQSKSRVYKKVGAVAVVCGALLLTGCVKQDIGVQVSEDGSGTFKVRALIDTSMMNAMGSGGGSMDPFGEGESGASTDTTIAEDPCASMMEDSSIPEGAEVKPMKDGKWCGAEVTVSFSNPEDFQTKFQAVMMSTSEEDSSNAQDAPPSLKKDGESWSFAYPMKSMCSDLSGSDTGDSGAAFMGMFMQGFELKMAVEMPGKVSKTNATSKSGGKSSWEFDWDGLLKFCQSGETELYASNTPGGAGGAFGGGLMLGAAALLGVGAGVGFYTARRRRAGQTAGTFAGAVQEPYRPQMHTPGQWGQPGTQPGTSNGAPGQWGQPGMMPPNTSNGAPGQWGQPGMMPPPPPPPAGGSGNGSFPG